MNRLFIFLFSFLLLGACGQESEAAAEYTIAAEKMEGLDDVFNFYGYLFLDEADSCILKSEGRGDVVFKKVDYRTGRLKSTIRRGRGPNEYTDLRIFDIDASSGCFHGAVPARTCSPITFSSDGIPLATTEIDAEAFFAIKLGDRFISYGNYSADDGKMFLLSDSEGRKITRFGEFPNDGMSCGYRYKTMAYQGKLISNEKLSRVAFLMDMGKVFDIYEIENEDTPRLIFSIRDKMPVYEPQEHVIGVQFKDLTIHYADAYSSEKYIYALYSGKKPGKSIDGDLQARETNRIEVYDWDGKHTCDLIADIPILSLCVSSDDRFIIAIYSDDGALKCCRFCLPEILSA